MMALVAAAMQINVADAFIKQKKQYTPLLFFKVPAGTMPECKYHRKKLLYALLSNHIIIDITSNLSHLTNAQKAMKWKR